MVRFIIGSIPRHPLSLVGIGLCLFSLASIVFLLVIEATIGKGNPYLGIFIYMIYPGLLLFGIFLVPVGAMLARWRRAKGGEVPLFPRLDLNVPHTRAIVLSLVVVSVLLLGVITTLSYQAYHITESVTFCGDLCHSVMEPEAVAYQASPHARVTCAECHVGSGAGWYVQTKLAGIPLRRVISERQLFEGDISQPFVLVSPAGYRQRAIATSTNWDATWCLVGDIPVNIGVDKILGRDVELPGCLTEICIVFSLI